MLHIVRSFRTTPVSTIRLSPMIHKRQKMNAATNSDGDNDDANINIDRTVTILQRSSKHIVALKPPSVVCHHSGWTGSRSKQKRGEEPEVPMLQRVRDALHDIDTRDTNNNGGDDIPTVRKVNLVHRLDRGASGALLFTYAGEDDDVAGSTATSVDNNTKKGDTAQLIESMAHPNSVKTYVALVRGEGILHGEDFKSKGWFEVSRPIKDEKGDELKDATTLFNFVAGQPENKELNQPRCSLVLCRPKQGRWHQIRRHLNGLSHPILGDTTHGHSKTNRHWKEKLNLPGERIALHLGRLQLVPTEGIPEGIDVSAPLLDDMLDMLRVHAPKVLEESLPTLKKAGILVDNNTKDEDKYEIGRWTIPETLTRQSKEDDDNDDSNDVDILEETDHYVVVGKPYAVVVHHSSWTKQSRSIPMLQRVRDETRRPVNLVHRLDRGASGCLLLSFQGNAAGGGDDGKQRATSCAVTKTLIESMQSREATKTYLALVDGDGTWNGVNYIEKGWFAFNNPVKDENSNVIDYAETEICFVASTILPPISNGTAAAVEGNDNMEGRKVSIVLAR